MTCHSAVYLKKTLFQRQELKYCMPKRRPLIITQAEDDVNTQDDDDQLNLNGFVIIIMCAFASLIVENPKEGKGQKVHHIPT